LLAPGFVLDWRRCKPFNPEFPEPASCVHSMHGDLPITAAMLCSNLAKMWVVKTASSAVALLLLKHTIPEMQYRLSICRAHETIQAQHGTHKTCTANI